MGAARAWRALSFAKDHGPPELRVVLRGPHGLAVTLGTEIAGQPQAAGDSRLPGIGMGLKARLEETLDEQFEGVAAGQR